MTKQSRRPPSDHDDARFSGLYPGAPIRAGREFGGLACFLGASGEATHFLTAGHLFAPEERGTPVFASIGPRSRETVVGTLAVNLLDIRGVDAAAIELTAAGRTMMASRRGGPKLCDVVGEAVVWQTDVRVFRATTCDYSRWSKTAIGPTDAQLDADQRGTYSVQDVIASHGTISSVGDSGCIVCAGKHNELALGICVGEYHAQSIFEPIARAIRLLTPFLGQLSLVGDQDDS